MRDELAQRPAVHDVVGGAVHVSATQLAAFASPNARRTAVQEQRLTHLKRVIASLDERQEALLHRLGVQGPLAPGSTPLSSRAVPVAGVYNHRHKTILLPPSASMIQFPLCNCGTMLHSMKELHDEHTACFSGRLQDQRLVTRILLDIERLQAWS